MKVLQLSHTSKKSGGYRHEHLLAKNISKKLNAKLEEVHFSGVFQSVGSQLLLALKGITKTKEEVNVIVARFAIGALLNSMLTKKKVLLVMHNWDPNDNKSWSLKLYYRKLWFLIKLFGPSRFSLVCISEYWKDVFDGLLNKRIPVFVFPNLLNSSFYESYRTQNKKKQVYLGQVSDKNDYSALEIIDRHLSDCGYYCFYSTIIEGAVVPYKNHNLLRISEDEYLKELAASTCSVSFPRVEEGWSRIAHESFLVGTPVIAFKKGGLQYLVSSAGGYLVDSPEEAIDIIESGPTLRKSKVEKLAADYDITQSDRYLDPILDFLN